MGAKSTRNSRNSGGRLKKGLMSHVNSMENTARRVDQSQGSLHVADHLGQLHSFDSAAEPSASSFIALKVPALNMENLNRSRHFKTNNLYGNQPSSKRLPESGRGSKRVLVNKTATGVFELQPRRRSQVNNGFDHGNTEMMASSGYRN